MLGSIDWSLEFNLERNTIDIYLGDIAFYLGDFYFVVNALDFILILVHFLFRFEVLRIEDFI